MWNNIKVMFTCVAPDREITVLGLEDYAEFHILNEVYVSEKQPEDLDSNDVTS